MKVNKLFWNVIQKFTYFGFLIIFLNVILLPGKMNNNQDLLLSNITVVATAIVLILFLVTMRKYMKNPKIRLLIYGVLIFLELVIQLYLSLKMQGMHVVDDIYMYLQSGRVLENSNASWPSYFSFASNNIIPTKMFILLMKFAEVINIKIVVIINIALFLCIDIALYCGYYILKNILNVKIEVLDVYVLISFLFQPVYMIALIMYTDALALCLMMLSITFFLKFNKERDIFRRVIYIILSSVFLGIGIGAKTNVMIVAIAIMLYLIFTDFRKNIKYMVVFAAILLGIVFINSNNLNKNVDPTKSFPFTYWIGMGFNSDTDGTYGKEVNGQYIDTWAITNQYKSKEDKDRYNKQFVKKSISDLGPMGLLSLWERKTNVMWSMGDEGTYSRGYTIMRERPKVYEYIYGNKRMIYLTLAQSIYILIMLGLLISSFKSFNNPKENKFILLTILGIYLFHTVLWEVQERYSYLAIILLLIAGVQGIFKVITFVDEKAKLASNTEFKMIYGLLGIMLLTGFSMDYSRVLTPINNENLISGQIFKNHEDFIKINPNEKLTEKIISPGNFNKIITDISPEEDIRVSIINNKTGKRQIINSDGDTYVSGSKGIYRIEVENRSEKIKQIKVIKSSRDFGILQKYDVSSKKGVYLGYQLLENTTTKQMGKVLYYGYVLLILVIYIFSAHHFFKHRFNK